MDKDEALQLAIEAIDNFKNVKGRYNTQIACEKLYAILPILKEALEQPTQEWQGLSDEEITNSESDYTDRRNGLLDVYGFAKDIELVLKGKNYGKV